MRPNIRFRVSWAIALISALCFAALSGFHVARATTIAPSVDLAFFGFSAEDICGSDEDEALTHCPICTLADDALLADFPRPVSWISCGVGLDLPCPETQCKNSFSTRVYKPRGPPIFT